MKLLYFSKNVIYYMFNMIYISCLELIYLCSYCFIARSHACSLFYLIQITLNIAPTEQIDNILKEH